VERRVRRIAHGDQPVAAVEGRAEDDIALVLFQEGERACQGPGRKSGNVGGDERRGSPSGPSRHADAKRVSETPPFLGDEGHVGADEPGEGESLGRARVQEAGARHLGSAGLERVEEECLLEPCGLLRRERRDEACLGPAWYRRFGDDQDVSAHDSLRSAASAFSFQAVRCVLPAASTAGRLATYAS
jgi:hypothetical protein